MAAAVPGFIRQGTALLWAKTAGLGGVRTAAQRSE